MKNTKAFTLVELIVVVTILAILSTIGFVSYSGYLAGVRDTNRIAQLKAIGDALHLYSTNKSLPTPDDKIDIKVGTGVNEKIISYQGYVGKDVIETVGYTAEGLDPKDGTYYSYYLTKDKKYFQLMAYLEEEQGLTYKLEISTKINAEIDYETRYPRVEGSKLGILTGTGGIPLQEMVTGELNIEYTLNEYISNIDNSSQFSGTGSSLIGLDGNINAGGISSSCNKLLEKKSSLKGKDGVYLINPEGNNPFPIYCDMTNDGGGWTLVVGIDSTNNSHGTILGFNEEKLVNIDGKGKYSDIIINKIAAEKVFRLTCNNSTQYFQDKTKKFISNGDAINIFTESYKDYENGNFTSNIDNNHGGGLNSYPTGVIELAYYGSNGCLNNPGGNWSNEGTLFVR